MHFQSLNSHEPALNSGKSQVGTFYWRKISHSQNRIKRMRQDKHKGEEPTPFIFICQSRVALRWVFHLLHSNCKVPCSMFRYFSSRILLSKKFIQFIRETTRHNHKLLNLVFYLYVIDLSYFKVNACCLRFLTLLELLRIG